MREKEHFFQKLRWHRPEKIRLLRRKANLNQAELAEAVNNYMREEMPDVYHASMALTQSMISNIELGRTNFSLPTLYAFAGFFKVSVERILTPAISQVVAEETYLLSQNDLSKEVNPDEKVAILPNFPSSLFSPHEEHNHFGVKDNLKKQYTEIYQFKSYMNFLFSPCTPYTKEEKISILQEMITFFEGSIFRNFLFSDYVSDTDSLQESLIYKDGTNTFYALPTLYSTHDFPESNKIQFIMIRNTRVSQIIDSCYLENKSLIANPITFLRIAIKILTVKKAAASLEPIAHFYRECVYQHLDTNLIKRSFTPEIQNYLDSLST